MIYIPAPPPASPVRSRPVPSTLQPSRERFVALFCVLGRSIVSSAGSAPWRRVLIHDTHYARHEWAILSGDKTWARSRSCRFSHCRVPPRAWYSCCCVCSHCAAYGFQISGSCLHAASDAAAAAARLPTSVASHGWRNQRSLGTRSRHSGCARSRSPRRRAHHTRNSLRTRRNHSHSTGCPWANAHSTAVSPATCTHT